MHEIYTLSFLAAQQRHRHFRKYQSSSKWGVALGSLHLTLGFLGVILGIVGLVAEYHANKYGSSLWCGLIFELTGVVGVVASKKWYSRTYIKCFCLASIMTIFTAILLFALTCVGIANHYAHFDPDYHVSLVNYMANVSANIIVLSLLEFVVSLVSVNVTMKAMRWRRRPPSLPISQQPVVIRETFMAPSSNTGTLPPSPNDYHQCVTVPDVLLQGVMPSVFGTTRHPRLTLGLTNSQVLDAANLMSLDGRRPHIFENSEDKIHNTPCFHSSIGHNRNY